MSEFVRRTVEKMAQTNKQQAFRYLIHYLKRCNVNWGTLVENQHPTEALQNSFVDEVIHNGIYVQMLPFTEGIDEQWVLDMQKEFGVEITPVTWQRKRADGSIQTIVTKKPILIGPCYMYQLYKEPHQRSSGLGYVNQYKSPMKPNNAARDQYPIAQTTIRIGEDEVRNLIMTSGADVAAHILGTYANSPDAVDNLGMHLLHDPQPSKLKQIDLSLEQIIDTNTIIGVTRHVFATLGIDITTNEAKIEEIFRDEEAAATDEDVKEVYEKELTADVK